MPFLAGSIRKCLALAVLTALFPALAIILYSGWEDRKHAIRDAEANSLRLVNALSGEQERITAGTRQLLSTLAQIPEVQRLDAAACSAIFRRLLEQNPVYVNIVAVDLQGNIFASALPFRGVNLADRKHFKDALANRDFSSGEYIVTRTVIRPALPFACPILDPEGRPKAVLTAPLSLDRYDTFFDTASLPPGSMLGFLDHRGIRLLHYPPQATNPLGKPIRKEIWAEISGPKEQGVALLVDADGVKRIHAFRQMRLKPEAPPYLYIQIGIPEREVLAGADELTRRNLLLLACAALLGLTSAWGIGNLTIGRFVARLVSATKRLGDGDLDARSGLPVESGELGQLAKAFDAMAEALARDIAARKSAENALRESEERIRAIFDATTDSVILLDPRGTILAINERGARRRGLSPQEMIGKSLYDHLPPEAARSRREKIEEAVRTGQAQFFDEVRGDRFYLLRVFPVFDAEGRVGQLASFSRDVTEHRRADEALQLAHDELEQKVLERTQELREANVRLTELDRIKSAFLSSASHELRTPLTSVLGFAKLIAKTFTRHMLPLVQDDEDLKGKARLILENLDVIVHEGERLTRLVNDLLDLNKIESGNVEWHDASADIAEIIRDAARSIEGQIKAKRGLALEIAVPDDLPRSCLDRDRIAQVLMNLLNNAAKFTDKGRIRVTARTIEGPGIEVRVTDTGPGVPEAHRERIFEKFYQVREHIDGDKPKGTGLGLFICRQIVEHYGGAIRVESEEGRGSAFIFTLPVR